MPAPTMPSWARIGAEVVCVDDAFGDAVALDLLGIVRLPMLHEVLTISWAGIGPARDVYLRGRLVGRSAGGAWLLFAEIPVRQGHALGIAWPADHFRPVLRGSLEDDLALFRRIADAARREVVDVV